MKSRRSLVRIVLAAMALVAASGKLSAYYYYLHLRTGAPPAPEKWDVNSLPGKTVRFFVAAQNGSPVTVLVPTLYSGDSYQAVLSNIRTAADVWNNVTTSGLRLAYGGLFTPGAGQTNTAISVEFSDDIPPGLLALSGRTTSTASADGSFYPISGAQMLLPRDMSANPSWGEQFFTTVVHEFGHTIGLQHSTASSAMSTWVTSASTRAMPLLADDIAAVSLLYPAADSATNFAAKSASITGKVMFTTGGPVNLAAVVAIAQNGAAVGTLTGPDGSYEIDGIPPDVYYIYAQPLPLPLEGEKTNLNVVYPLDVDGKTPLGPSCVQSNCSFTATFFPGTTNWRQAGTVTLAPGQAHGPVDFTVQPRGSMPVDSVTTYGFVPGSSNYVKPNGVVVSTPPVTRGGARQSLVFTGRGLYDATNGNFLNGANFDDLGYSLQILRGSARTYLSSNSYYYAAVDVVVSFFSGPGWRHLIVNTTDDIYVLPSAIRVVSSPAPAIAAVNAAAGGSLAISGSSFTGLTRIAFDGLPVVPQSVAADGSLIVTPPVAPPGYTAHLTALNSDGQSSYYLQGNSGKTYTYPGSGTPSIQVTPATLAPGANTVIVNGTSTNFVAGQTVVGFGTSSVTVNSVQVSPDGLSLTLNVNSSAATPIPTSSISVTTGLTVLTLTGQ